MRTSLGIAGPSWDQNSPLVYSETAELGRVPSRWQRWLYTASRENVSPHLQSGFLSVFTWITQKALVRLQEWVKPVMLKQGGRMTLSPTKKERK